MPRLRPVVFSFTILSILVLSTFCSAAAPDRIAGPVTTASTVSLGSGLRTHPWAEYDQGPIEASFQLHDLAFVIAPSISQQKALEQLLAQQQDPRSPNYHKWLTPEQYGDRFGLSPNDLKRITAWLQSQGFTNVSVVRSANIVMFSGTAAQVEASFRTQVHRYEVEGQFQFSNITPPQIPAALSGIVMGMRGLNNLHMKSMLKRRMSDYNDSSFFSGQLLAPADIATIYDIPSSMDGTGQTIAIIGRSDIFEADLADFRTGFGLPTISGCTSDPTSGVITVCNTTYFQYVLVLNGAETDPLAPDSIATGDLVESDLDLEWSGATAPKAKIIYVNAPAQTGNDVVEAMSYAITNKVAPVVSMSFGLCEYGTAVNQALGSVGFTETEFKQANSQGMTIVNSSGDGSAGECDYERGNHTAQYGYTVDYPSSSPEVTAVGGTLIPLISPDEYGSGSGYWNTTGTTGGSALMYIPEQAWNEVEEFGAYCVANPTNSFCTSNGVTDWASAQQAFGIGGGGGGISNCATINTSTGQCLTGYPQPSYQSGLSVTLPSPAPETTTPARYVPDVSLLSSPDFPGYIFCTSQKEVGGSSSSSSCSTSIADSLATWGTVAGGTSFAAPVFAGMVALLNQSLSSTSLGNINPTLYSLAATTSNGAFHPVTTPSTGAYSNGVYCTPNTPGAPQPSQLWCPASGFLGFDTYNFDATTKYNLVTGLGSVDVNKLAIAWAAGRTASTITVQASPPQVLDGQQVTLTATVVGSSPTGSVSFFNNGSATAFGSATLSAGVATFSTTTLPIGTNNITATYNGDGYNAPSTTVTPAVVVVIAPTFTLATSGATSHTVLAGQSSLTYQFVATPTGGATTFAAAVNIGCTFTPTDPTLTSSICSYSVNGGAPQSGTGVIPAGSGTSTVAVTIQTAGPNSGTGTQFRRRADNRLPWLPSSLPLAGIVVAGIAGRKLSKYSLVASLCVALALAGFLIACGSSPHPITVAVSGSSSSIYPQNTGWTNSTATFTAALTNDSGNKGVTWAVSTANGGTIAATDPTHATYTPPTVAAGLPPSVTITATSVADTSKSNTASIKLNPTTVPGVYNVTVTANETGATPQSQQVQLTVN